MIRKLLIILALLAPTVAHAEWYEARSRNFEVYSAGSAEQARDFAAKLERFNYVLRTYHNVTAPASRNRLRVFLLESTDAVARMAGAPGSAVAGYYVPTSRGAFLVGTYAHIRQASRRRDGSMSGANIDAEDILLHEYTHHFMYQYFPATYPTWYSEGFAEFWGQTQFHEHDVVEVGRPAEGRFETFHVLGWLPIERLLRAHSYSEIGGANVFLLYAEGWLFVRYAFQHSDVQHQLQQYLALINHGTSYEDAARQAFPNIDHLNSELFDYAHRSRFDVLTLPFRAIDIGEIDVRQLRPAEGAMLGFDIKISQGYEQREAADFAEDVRAEAAHYPDDPYALEILMEAERLAGNNAQALSAAEHLLQVEPHNARAMAVKGFVAVAGLQASHSTDAHAWDGAHQLFRQAMQADPNDAFVLEGYYSSFLAQGVLPPADAQNALYSATELAPSDSELRYELARDFEMRHMIPEAIAIIRPDAYSAPDDGHESPREKERRERREQRERQAGREVHETALEMLTRLEATQGRNGSDGQAAAAPQATSG
jgi:Flp pilus assembly protein TadD